jgi:hypothetical protein
VEDKYVDWHRKKKQKTLSDEHRLVQRKERQRPPVTRDTHARNRPANYIYIRAHIYRQHTTGDWKMLRRIFLSTVDFSEKQQQHMAKNKKKKKKTFNRAHFVTCSLFLKKFF